ncbi:MAG: tRNA (adenosine(37)-N6)-dimethylallyltransferase MiaA [Verrucomicrobiota bacterium]|nr:tRNA (adenosine(37)-N6)-dimethylallyltransferase MiaA [Limisphaerales bacterium]
MAQHPIKQSIFLAGPTAVGKSAVALALAENIGGEIISVDSMQVYRGLDLGTAKPSAEERTRVPHHLIDVVELSEPFDAAKFVALANQAVAAIHSCSRVPIFCGGTGLYFKAYLEGLGEAPPSDAHLRAELEATPLAELLRELEQRDAVTFARIDRQNPRRLVRAVEVIRLTGKPFSEQRAEWKSKVQSSRKEVIFVLTRQPVDLHARINLRVDEMFARGLIVETRRCLDHGLAQNKTAMQAIGYRQVVEHLRGERSLSETIELVKSKTRQFAKRQMTWFRKQANAQWVELKPGDSLIEVRQHLSELGSG